MESQDNNQRLYPDSYRDDDEITLKELESILVGMKSTDAKGQHINF